MGHPSFFRGVKLKVEWNLKNSLGACRGYQGDPQKAKKKINNGEFLHPIFTRIWTWDPSRCWKIVFKLLKWQFNQSFWQELWIKKFFNKHASSLRGLGVEASLRVWEVLGSNPGGNMEIGQNFKNLPVKYLVLWCLGVPSGSSLTPWRVFKISSNFNFLCSKKRRVPELL